MKQALIVAFILMSVSMNAQYYYRDIILAAKTTELWEAYKKNGIKKVTLTSREGDGTPTEGFAGQQVVAPDFSSMVTFTASQNDGQTILDTRYSKTGKIISSVDSSQGYSSSTAYQYNEAGQLVSIESQTYSDGKPVDVEKHQWEYDGSGKPSRMVRTKNGTDETLVTFLKDEQGNIAEENSVRAGARLPSVYYYYDNVNRLTDIVRYSRQAKRLLPDYVFEYDAKGKLTSMLVIPEGSDQYQRWVYQYEESNLKKSESCFDKRKKLLGKIEYLYSK